MTAALSTNADSVDIEYHDDLNILTYKVHSRDIYVDHRINKNCMVSYIEAGKGEDVIFLHGFTPVGKSRFIKQVPEFSSKYHMLVPDLLGFGDSEKPEATYNMSLFTSFVEEFMDSLYVKSANIIGSSFGGQIAATFAAEKSDRVKKLVLVSPSGLMEMPTRQGKNYFEMLQDPTYERAKEYLQYCEGENSVGREQVDEFLDKAITSKKAIMSTAMNALVYDTTFKGKLKRIRTPTLILWGRRDEIVPIEHLRKFEELIPNCETHVINDAGHTPFVETPSKKFANPVLAFLSKN